MAIITISRGTFSGGKELAECLENKLGFKCLSREVLVEAARRYGAQLENLTRALNDKPGILEGMTSERVHYLAYIQAALIKDARDERLVYHGHAGQLLLRDVPHVLRVRVIAGMEYRIKAAMERNKLSREQAVEYIKKVDSDRVRWTKFLYHADWYDLSLYDLAINLDKIGMSGACDMISLIVQREEFQPTPQSQKKLGDLALATDIRARIAANETISDKDVEIEADDGAVTILGRVDSSVDADNIRNLIRHVPGVKDISSKLRVSLR